MFCPNCGKNITDDSSFCEYCGRKIDIQPQKLTPVTNQSLFYSKDWSKSGFHIASIPYFDILVTQDYFYLIKFPKSNASAIGLLIGIFFSLIGMVIGGYVGSSIEKNKRKEFRSRWIHPDGLLITNDYENNCLFKIPIANLKNSLFFEGKKITLSYQGEAISLKSKNNEVNRLLALVNRI